MNSTNRLGAEQDADAFEEDQIHDSLRNPLFDELTKLTAFVLEVPVVAVKLMDRDHDSLFHRVVSSRQLLMVENALEDPEHSGHPFVRGKMKLRFFAGAPLITQSGNIFGALCVIDHQPRKLDEKQIAIFKLLASQVVIQFEKHRYEQIIQNLNAVIVENSRLATLGQMTAEIVHEINNPLSVIQARAGLLLLQSKKETHTNAMTSDIAKKLLQTTQRISQIIKSVKTFSRNGEHESFENVQISDLIECTLSFCVDRLRFFSVELIKVSIPPNLQINCKSVQISQVLLNLINNSIDAIAELPERWIRIEVKELAEKVEIQVIDCGNGIPAAVLEKLFNPFFTTKSKGQGTGLGLSISRGIVEAHQGTVTYDESSGHTSFVITLPKAT